MQLGQNMVHAQPRMPWPMGNSGGTRAAAQVRGEHRAGQGCEWYVLEVAI